MGRVASSYWHGALFCGAFFFIGVSLAFNIFTAFTIDIFCALEEDEEMNPVEDQNLQKMQAEKKKNDQVLHVLVPPAVVKARAHKGAVEGLDDVMAEIRA